MIIEECFDVSFIIINRHSSIVYIVQWLCEMYVIDTFQICENARQDLANISSQYFSAILECAKIIPDNTTKDIDIEKLAGLRCHVGNCLL